MGLWSVSMLAPAELLRVLRVPSTVVALAQGLVQVTFPRSDGTLTLALPCAGPIFCQLSGAPACRPSPTKRLRIPGCDSGLCRPIGPGGDARIHRMLESDARLK